MIGQSEKIRGYLEFWILQCDDKYSRNTTTVSPVLNSLKLDIYREVKSFYK